MSTSRKGRQGRKGEYRKQFLKVIVELKSVEKLVPVHSKLVLTQLRLSQRRLGLLINFGEVHFKNGIERIVNGLAEETPPSLRHTLLGFFASLAPFA